MEPRFLGCPGQPVALICVYLGTNRDCWPSTGDTWKLDKQERAACFGQMRAVIWHRLKCVEENTWKQEQLNAVNVIKIWQALTDRSYITATGTAATDRPTDRRCTLTDCWSQLRLTAFTARYGLDIRMLVIVCLQRTFSTRTSGCPSEQYLLCFSRVTLLPLLTLSLTLSLLSCSLNSSYKQLRHDGDRNSVFWHVTPCGLCNSYSVGICEQSKFSISHCVLVEPKHHLCARSPDAKLPDSHRLLHRWFTEMCFLHFDCLPLWETEINRSYETSEPIQ